MTERIIAGPATIGNLFGFYGHAVPTGRYAIVDDCEYANGGYGPCSSNGKLYGSLEQAQLALDARKPHGSRIEEN